MIYIEGLGYIEDRTKRKTENTDTAAGSSFDSIFKAETTIYAVPEAGEEQENTPAEGNFPAELEPYFQEASSEYGIDETLLKAVARAESNFNAGAVSSAGAIGIMQLMPATASSLGVSNPYDARQNIMGGAKYLSSLLAKYNQNISLALAAYNAGSGNVDKYGGIPPFTETQNYVNRILAYMGEGTDGTYTVYASADNPASDKHYVSTIYAQAAGSTASVTPVHTVSAIPETRV